MYLLIKPIQMRIFALCLISFTMLACGSSSSSEQPASSPLVAAEKAEAKFDWLVGKWKRIQENQTHITYENWAKVSEAQYAGLGFIMQESDTVWQEELRLIKNDSSWTLEVQTPGNDDMVVFTLTTKLDTTFTVENPEHDFPQAIKYWIADGHLFSYVSGPERNLNYEFEPLP